MIEAMPAINLVEVLKLVPGFQVFYANGSIAGVTAHGQSDRFPRRLEIRVDGRSVYTPINSSVSWESLGLKLEDVESIEVVRGSNIAAYGANAAQGAINISTRNPFLNSGTELTVTAGDRQTRDTQLRHTHHNADAAFSVRAHYSENQGFEQLNDQSYVTSLAVGGAHAPTLLNEFSWELGLSEGTLGFGDGDRPAEFADESISHYWAAANWTRRKEQHQTKLMAAANFGEYDRSRTATLSQELGITPADFANQFPGEPDRLIETEDGRREYQQYDIEFEHHFSPNAEHTGIWGSGLRYQWLEAPTQFDSEDSTDELIAFLFGNWQWRPTERWDLHLGFMVEDHSSLKEELSPRAGINYHLNDNHHIRVSVSEAYRQPSLYERKRVLQRTTSSGQIADLIFISDPDLGAERFQTYELGYLGYWFDRRLSVDYRLFREYLDDGIDYVKYEPFNDINNKFRRRENASHHRITGYETQLIWRPDTTWLIAAQYANIRIFGEIIAPGGNSVLAVRSPQHTGSLLISKRLPRQWQVSFSTYHQSFVNWRGGTRIPSWHRYDAKLAKTWQSGPREIRLELIGQNLSDEQYLEYQRRNVMKQTLYARLQVRF